MKKLLSILMALMLALSLAFTAFACTPNNPDSEVESESVSESLSEPESVYIPEPIVGAGENGEINLESVLEILDPVLDNDYVTASISGSVEFKEEDASAFVAEVNANAYLKRTVKGYDVIAKIRITIDGTSADVHIYFVDGLGVIGQGTDGQMDYKAEELGSFNGLINMLNQEIANDPDATEIYMSAMPVLEEIKGMLGGENAIGDMQFSMDFAQNVNDVIDFVLENQNETVHDMLLTLLGVDPTDEEAVAEIKSFIEDFYKDNPSVTVFIERVVNKINTLLMDSARADAEANGTEFVADDVFQINLREIVDAIQEETGMTTAEIVEALNGELSGAGFVFPAPEFGETIYDYLTVYLEAVTVNAVAQAITEDDTATFASIIDGIIEMSKEITLKDVINLVANLLGDISGDTSTDSDESTAVDYVAVIEEMNLTADKLSIYFAFASDDLSRPTSLTLDVNVGVSIDRVVYSGEDGQPGDADVYETVAYTVALNLSCAFEYTKPLIEFKIPASVKDLIVLE